MLAPPLREYHQQGRVIGCGDDPEECAVALREPRAKDERGCKGDRRQQAVRVDDGAGNDCREPAGPEAERHRKEGRDRDRTGEIPHQRSTEQGHGGQGDREEERQRQIGDYPALQQDRSEHIGDAADHRCHEPGKASLSGEYPEEQTGQG